MDHERNQGTPLTSLMRWDRDGELCSEDLDRLLERLQAQEARQLTNQLATSSSTT
jgi:hypothetical protein